MLRQSMVTVVNRPAGQFSMAVSDVTLMLSKGSVKVILTWPCGEALPPMLLRPLL